MLRGVVMISAPRGRGEREGLICPLRVSRSSVESHEGSVIVIDEYNYNELMLDNYHNYKYDDYMK